MAGIKVESHVYRLKGLTPILGSLPATKNLREIYTTPKAPADTDARAELFDYERDDKSLTVFARDKRGQLCVMGYQIKGFFKAALCAIRSQYEITNYKSKVDSLLFVEPRFVPLIREGAPILGEDDINERPLRADTPKGERVSLAASEQVDDPWSIEIEITLLPNGSTKATKGIPLSWEVVEAALDYGAFRGLGQWRNADYGRFTWDHAE